MDVDRQTMYDRFNDTGKHSTEWVRITKEFLKLAFASVRREASCPCSRCENRKLLSEYEMSTHLTKKGFMSNHLWWHQHGEVQLVVADESDGNDDVDWMDDIVVDIRRGYDLEFECSNRHGDRISPLLPWPLSTHRNIYDINNKVR
jgi:hypothetical protein